MRRPGLYLLLSLLLATHSLRAQPISRYNSFSYGVNEGLLQTTIGDLAVDQNNFCWITFPNGLQRFDGHQFVTVRVQPGLPDDKNVRLFRCASGELLFSHSRGISKYEVSTNRFVEVFRQDANLRLPVFFIGEDDGKIYIYDGAARIHGLDSRTYEKKSSFTTSLEGYNTQYEQRPAFSQNIADHLAGFWIQQTLYIADLRNQKIAYRVTIPVASMFFLKLLPGPKAQYYTYSHHNAIQEYDFATGKNSFTIIKGKNNSEMISRLIPFRWGNNDLLAINQHLYETTPSYSQLLAQIVDYKNESVSGNSGIADLVEDGAGNLYVQTISGGIRKLIRNNYAIKYYGLADKKKNAVLGILPDKSENRILVGTVASGLLVFDTLQTLIRHIPELPGIGSFGVNAMIKDRKGDYLLFVRGEKGPWRLKSDLSAITPGNHSAPEEYAANGRIDYFGSKIYQDEKSALVQSMFHLYRTDLSNNHTTVTRLSGDYVLDRLWIDGMIVSHNEDSLVFTDAGTLRELRKIPFPNTGGVRCYARSGDGNILVGTNKGLFRINATGKILQHWSKENGLPDECIYAIATDGSDTWCSSNKGLFRIDNANSILQLTREDGLQENEFNSTVVARSEDGELFFGGMNGVSSFYPSKIRGFDEKIELIVTRIRINNEDLQNDNAPWNVNAIATPYHRNSFSIDFVAMGQNIPTQYVYQYRVKGIDQEWVQSGGLQTIRYSLPPGKYTLQLYASRSFNQQAEPMKEITITVRPPFWKSWWFLGGLLVIAMATLAIGINRHNRRKYAKRLQQFEHEQQIKGERERISKDLHDHLGAYANAVLFTAEQLETEKSGNKRNELISDIKFASKDIITSLRETVWALKKETYTAEDCLLRIKNFIQPLTRYYNSIQFKVIGEAPGKVELHYTKALNLVRIVQEAIGNSLKHAVPAHIIVSSEEQDGRWKLVVQDDGKSFDYTEARRTEQGNGLHNMESRAANAGFGFELHSTPGQGTVITIIV